MRAAAPAGPAIQVGGEGTAQPRWSHDGRKLFYFGPDRKVMEVTIDVRNGEVAAGSPRAVLQTHVVAPRFADFQFDVTVDGDFIVNSLKPGAPLTIIAGWPELLKR